MPVAVHSSAREILPANDRSNSRRERNTAIGIKRNRCHIIAVSLGEYLRFLDRRASRFFNRYDHRIIRTFRQRNSQRRIAPMAESFRPRTAGGCVGHTSIPTFGSTTKLQHKNLIISSHTHARGIFKDLMQTVCQRSH